MVNFASVGDDLKGFVTGDIEIAGKRVPKAALAGVAVGGVVLFVVISKRKGQPGNEAAVGLPGAIGNSNPSMSSSGTADSTALGQSAIDQLSSQLGGGLPSPNLDFGMGGNPNTSIQPDIGYSSGNLSDFLSQLPSISSFQNPAFQALPDLSSYGFSQPLAQYGQDVGVPIAPYSNPSVTTRSAVAQQNTVIGKPITKINQNILDGLRSFLQPKVITGTTKGNAIVKQPGSISIFGGTVPTPSVKPVTPVKSGNAIVTNPVNLFKNFFGGSVTPVKPIVIPANPLPTPAINYGGMGWNWSKPVPLPAPPKPAPLPNTKGVSIFNFK